MIVFCFVFIYPHCKVKVCTPKFPNRLVPKRNMFHWAADQLLFSLGFFIHVAGVPGWVLFCPCGRSPRLGTFLSLWQESQARYFFVPVAGVPDWVLLLSLWQVFQAGYFFVPVCGMSPRPGTSFAPVAGVPGWILFFCPCGRSPKLGTFFVPVLGVPGQVLFCSCGTSPRLGTFWGPWQSPRPGTFFPLYQESQAGYFCTGCDRGGMHCHTLYKT